MKPNYTDVPLSQWIELLETAADLCGALHAWGGNRPEGPLRMLRPRNADSGVLLDPEHEPLRQLMDAILKIRTYKNTEPKTMTRKRRSK